MKRLLLPFLLLILISPLKLFSQCATYEVPIKERVDESTFIIEGKVTSQTSFWDAPHHMIYTVNEIEVYKVFKGNLTQTKVEVVTVGGVVGLDAIMAHPALELQVGEMGIFMGNSSAVSFPTNMASSNVLRLDIYADQQGFIKYNWAAQIAADLYNMYISIGSVYQVIQTHTGMGYNVIKPTPNVPNPVQGNAATSITSFSPDTITAGTESVLTIKGVDFGATQGTGKVEFKDANNGGSSDYAVLNTQIVSWSDTMIKVMVPSRAGTGKVTVTSDALGSDVSTNSVVIRYSQLNPVSGGVAGKPRHIDQDNNGGYVWRMEPKFDSDSLPKARFLDAMEDWRCGTFINWENGDTTHVDTVLSDGVQVVRWGSLNSGTLGVCFSQWSGCFNAQNKIEWWVKGMDIVFDSTRNWYFGTGTPGFSQYDFQSVAVHELGHGHQLGHVIKSTEIMHYSISNGQTKRNLSTDDLAGGNHVMTQSTVKWTCGGAPTQMTKLTTTNCAIGIPMAGFTTNKTSACVSETVTFTDSSEGVFSTWAWDFGSGASPATAIGQGPHNVTYSTGGTKTVQLIIDGAKGADTATKTNLITVTAAPSTPTISGVNTTCKGSTETYSISGVTGETYQWTISSGGTFNGGSTGTSVDIDWDTKGGPYTVSVKAYNQCDSSSAATFMVTVNDIPANPTGGFNIADKICIGQVTYTVNTVSDATGYQWTLTNGGNIVGADSLASVNVDWTTPGGIYTLSVKAKNACGLSAASFADFTSVLGKPNTPSGLDLDAENCAGETSTVSVTNDANTTGYKWNLSGGGTITSADNVNPITIDWTAAGGPYTLTVKQFNICDSSDNASGTTNIPDKPVADYTFIVGGANVDFTNTTTGATDYDWDFGDGTGTSTDQDPTYTYTANGNYDVVLIASNSCLDDTSTQQVSITKVGIDVLNNTIKINIYPNPLKDKALITLKGDLSDEYTFELYDVNGQIVKTIAITEKETTLDASELSAGVYMYKIREGNNLLQDGKLIIE